MFITVVGNTAKLLVTAKDQKNGLMDIPTNLVWESSDPGVASVSDSGIITAVAEGQCAVTAKSDAITGTIEVQVKNPVLTSITLTPTKI
jgi:trimeric autotransporter adhesin